MFNLGKNTQREFLGHVPDVRVRHMNGHTDSVLLTRNMTQSNSFTSPAKRERTLVNNTHRHSLPPNVSLKSPIQRRNAISSPSNRMYKLTCVIREAHNQSVFGVAFNSINRSQPTDPLLFATVAGHYITVYQCNLNIDLEEISIENPPEIPTVHLLHSFSDPAGDKEEFYCCAWSRDTIGNGASDLWTDCCESLQPRPTPHPHQGPVKLSSTSILPPHQQIIAAAGKRGVIRILCPTLASCPASLIGHGSSINELRFHPRDPALLFSFSKDYTIRLWNIANHVTVCVFGGAEGHRAEVLHGDLSLTGDLLITAAMDHCIKIWRLNTPEIANAVIDSFNYCARSNTKPFPVLVQHFPEFSSRDVHGNYVDCARWFGSLVISKSCENSVALWKPGGLVDDLPPNTSELCDGSPSSTDVGGLRLPDRMHHIGSHTGQKGNIPCAPGVPTEHKTSVIHQLKANDCNLWYIRFDVDLKNQVLALGTGTGPSRVYLWDLSNPEGALNLPAQVLQIPPINEVNPGGLPLTNSAIRQTRFANDGDILLCVGDNGLIVRFDKF
ncbi:unnamed protein product [Heterobilharzia americana]|nr:unnamed protein product [Heterobilharzia americana]